MGGAFSHYLWKIRLSHYFVIHSMYNYTCDFINIIAIASYLSCVPNIDTFGINAPIQKCSRHVKPDAYVDHEK